MRLSAYISLVTSFAIKKINSEFCGECEHAKNLKTETLIYIFKWCFHRHCHRHILSSPMKTEISVLTVTTCFMIMNNIFLPLHSSQILHVLSLKPHRSWQSLRCLLTWINNVLLAQEPSQSPATRNNIKNGMDRSIIQFQGFDWLSDHGMWAIIPCQGPRSGFWSGVVG